MVERISSLINLIPQDINTRIMFSLPRLAVFGLYFKQVDGVKASRPFGTKVKKYLILNTEDTVNAYGYVKLTLVRLTASTEGLKHTHTHTHCYTQGHPGHRHFQP